MHLRIMVSGSSYFYAPFALVKTMPQKEQFIKEVKIIACDVTVKLDSIYHD